MMADQRGRSRPGEGFHLLGCDLIRHAQNGRFARRLAGVFARLPSTRTQEKCS